MKEMRAPISAEDEVRLNAHRHDEEITQANGGITVLYPGRWQHLINSARDDVLFAALQRIDILEVRLRALEATLPKENL
jgi:hypothetical protein